MAAELFDLIIFLIFLLMIVAVVLLLIRKLFPAIYEVARYIVGGLALIAVLVKLKPFILRLFS